MTSEDFDLSELRTLSAQEVADAVGVPIETVWSAAKNGSLYGRKLGREWRFTIPAVKEWIGLQEGAASSLRGAAVPAGSDVVPEPRKPRKRATSR